MRDKVEIVVVEVIKALPGKEKELKAVLKGVPSLLGEGCLQYDLFEPTEGSGEFLIFMR